MAEDTRDQLIADLRRVLKEGIAFDLAGWNRRLTQLRQQYREAYTQLHQQAVLGPQEATRRKRLKSDSRYIRLATLAQIDKMNAPELRMWERAVDALPACVEFHSQLLDAATVCPSCRFQPTQAARQGSAASRLVQLEAELAQSAAARLTDTMLVDKSWLCPREVFPIVALRRIAYAPQGELVVTHGGLTVEEMIVPLITLARQDQG